MPSESLEDRQKDLEKRNREIGRLTVIFNRGEITREQPLAREIFGEAVNNARILKVKRSEQVKTTYRVNYENAVALISAIGIYNQQMFTLSQIIAASGIPDAEEIEKNIMAYISQRATERNYLVSIADLLAAAASNGNADLADIFKQRVLNAASVVAPDLEMKGGEITFEPAAFDAQTAMARSQLAKVYQDVAYGIVDELRAGFAYMAGMSVTDKSLAHQYWKTHGKLSSELSGRARDYTQRASDLIKLIKRGAAQDMAHTRAKMN